MTLDEQRIPIWIPNDEEHNTCLMHLWLPVQCINYLFQKEYDEHPELYDPYPSSYYTLVGDHPSIMRPIPRDMQFNFQVPPIYNLIDVTNIGRPDGG